MHYKNTSSCCSDKSGNRQYSTMDRRGNLRKSYLCKERIFIFASAREGLQWSTLCLLCLSLLLLTCCADTDTPVSQATLQTETIESDDEYVYFVGDTWSSVVFAHKEHSDRENSDCYICHDHEPMVGSSKWNCSACHTANDPENLCDQDENHGCIMAQCNSCHEERVESSPNAPFIDCSGETGEGGCCLECHQGGYLASSGVLLDSPVEGVNYQTETISNTTDSNGTFFYMEGEIVTFSIADLILGRTLGGPIKTIVDLVEGAVDAYDPTVTNICRFLITLDQDGDPDNGITLTQEIITEVEGRNIDFEQGIDDFSNDPDVEALIDVLNNLSGVFTANTPRSLCAAEDAQIHLTATLISINFGPLVTFPGALQVSGSSGCNAMGCHSQLPSANGTYHIDETYPDGTLNGSPIYKHDTQNYWIHWNSAGEDDEWKLSANTTIGSYQHHYSWTDTGGENTYPPLGGWPSGCFTDEGKQITAILSPLGGITGTLWVGEQLTGTYYYFDDEGDTESGTTYQWYRCDDNIGTNDVMISGADSQTYTLVSEDENKYIRFGVTPGAASGNNQGEEIQSGPAGPIIVNGPPVATDVSISGEKNVNAVLTGGYTYTDSLGDTEDGTTFKWYRYSSAAGSGEEVIAGATSMTYTLQNNDQGKYIKFEVTPGASTGISPGTPVKSTSFGPIDPDPLNQAPTSSTPVISGAGGCICINSELTASYTYSDAEDDPEGSSTYQWYIETAVGSGEYEAINGATSLTCTVTDDCDEGKYVKFKVTPIATTGNSPGTTVESNPIQIQIDPDNQPPVVSNVYIQTPVYVESQAVGYYDYYDADGNIDTSTFQWYVADTINGTYTAVSGATSYIFIPPDSSYEGKYLKLRVTPHSGCGNNTSVVSVESDPVEINPSLNNAYPVVDNVSITGTVRVAETLTGVYDYTDADSDPDCSTLQWYYSADQDGTYTAISGATSENYTPPDNGVYEGKYLKFCVTPISCSGNNYIDPPEVYSDAFGPLSYSLSNVPPTVSNVLIDEESIPEGEDECICANTELIGSYDYYDQEGSPEDESSTSYQWYVSDSESGTYTAISGATLITYTPPKIYEGKYLKLGVRARSQWGNPSYGTEVLSSAYQIGPDREDSVPVAIMPTGMKVSLSDVSGVNGVYELDTVNYPGGQFNGKPIYKHETENYWIHWNTSSGYEYDYIWAIGDTPTSDQYLYSALSPLGTGNTPPSGWWPSLSDDPGAVPVMPNSGISGTYSRIIEEGITAPGSTPIGIPGNPYITGSTITGTYEFYDAESDPELGSTYQWYRCIDEAGTNDTPISGANLQSYTPTSADVGYYLRFEVVPGAASGNTPGIGSKSIAVGPITDTTVYTGEISSASDVDQLTIHLDSASDVVIDVQAFESCSGMKPIPSDFFDGVHSNNDLIANIYLFTDTTGTLIDSSIGGYPAPSYTPGVHDTRTGQSPYLSLSDLSAGDYIISIGSYTLSETDAWNGENTDSQNSYWTTGTDYYGNTITNFYNIFVTIDPN